MQLLFHASPEASLMQPAALDFAATLSHIAQSGMLIALTIRDATDAREFIARLRLMLSDEQPSQDYIPIYSSFARCLGILARLHQTVAPEVLAVRCPCYLLEIDCLVDDEGNVPFAQNDSCSTCPLFAGLESALRTIFLIDSVFLVARLQVPR
jgi:hypothetical protein